MTISNKTGLTTIEKLHIIQANKFIERVQPKWSTITQRFFLYCIGKVNNDKEHFEEFEINLSDLPDILGYARGVKLRGDEVKTIFEELFTNNSVKIVKDQGNGKKSYEGQVLFQRIFFDEKLNKGFIQFSDVMRDQVLQLNKKQIPFTDFQYKEIINIQGSYSSRLIELLYQYKTIGKRKFDIENLRTLLGVPENTYSVFSDFKKRIIDQAVKEINENHKSSITVEYNTIRVGRSIGKIEFIISTRKKITEKENLATQQIKLIEEEIAAEPINPDSEFAKIFKKMGVI